MITIYEENLLKPDGTPKPGCNKLILDESISWERAREEDKNNWLRRGKNKEEWMGLPIQIEYLPEGKPKGLVIQALLNSTPEEIILIKQFLGLIS